MSPDYSIAAIPTVYRGRAYRSRLEARWAAFFDRLGLVAEYEPFDLGVWSPDFLLTEIKTLVEIKPITEFDAKTWKKMLAACKRRRLLSGENQINALFLSMVAPVHSEEGIVQLGWVAMPWHDQAAKALPAYVAWMKHASKPLFIADIAAMTAGGFCTTDTEIAWSADNLSELVDTMPTAYCDYTMEQWAAATSDVQWLPDESSP